ncbi:hypothetical protein AU05_17320 [Ectopseudomonas composti]|uniref:Uncharacterized protein n=1 Tax=Ectopseudomonas composti TaxID=658457 RepID=A0ABN0SAR4_9GAMM|nr:DUF6338 family protein [Pseudomonas composti]EZH79570.1 hypothetical protein AU05_17320 [Pseudomonas composti]
MDEILGELVPLLNFLLPGFIATTVFYWLSDAQKPGQFERLVQAVIGTTLISLIMPLVRDSALWIGDRWIALGIWSDRADAVVPHLIAFGIGLILALAANHDVFYRFARMCSLTSRASHSDWAYAFRTRPGKFVVLQLLDGRRLIGYPEVWPTNPHDGYFLMLSPRWVRDDGSHYDDQGIGCMIIANIDVQWVEILTVGPEKEEKEQWLCRIKKVYQRILARFESGTTG